MTPPSSSNSAPHTAHANVPFACLPTVPSGISGGSAVSPFSDFEVLRFRARGALAFFASSRFGSGAIGGSPTVRKAQPLHALPVTAVPAAEGLLNVPSLP